MPANTPAPQLLTQAAHEALRRGDAQRAKEHFLQLQAQGHESFDARLGLAYACHALGQGAEALRAVDGALAIDAHNLPALALKGDLLLAAGQAAAAGEFYRAALDSVESAQSLPPPLRAEWERASAMHRQVVTHLADELRSSLGPPASERMAQGLDILLGVRQFFPSQPRHFLLPGLPTIQFHDRAAFPWLDAIEAATAVIRDEMLEVLNHQQLLQPYVQSDPRRPAPRNGGLVDNPAWSAFHLWKNGKVVPEAAQRCPRTLQALAGAPLASMQGRSPSALFSVLRPGAHIPPHHGFLNTRLIVHLPLLVPKGCALRVGNDTREWVEGRAWLFDDTIEHEAWNPTDRVRVILLFEVWRPELTVAERAQVQALFQEVDRRSGAPGEWSI
jgi:aspartate beta-hydroxylase